MGHWVCGWSVAVVVGVVFGDLSEEMEKSDGREMGGGTEMR